MPDYPPFGKRMLMDNGWYRCCARDDVELVTDPSPRSAATRVVTDDGAEYEADVLVLATGFDVAALPRRRSRSRAATAGRLREVWDDDDARAYLGMAVPGFPNFFCLLRARTPSPATAAA